MVADPWLGFPLKPIDASTTASSVDHLYYFLTALTLFFTFSIFTTIFYFMVKYRRRSPDERPKAIEASSALEVIWTVIPALLCAFAVTGH